MAFFKVGQHIEELNTGIRNFIKAKLDYYELRAFKEGMRASTRIVKLFVYGSVLFMFLTFLSIGVSIIIGRALEDYALGFLIVAGFYLVVLALVLSFGHYIISRILVRIVSKELRDDKTIIQKRMDDDKENE